MTHIGECEECGRRAELERYMMMSGEDPLVCPACFAKFEMMAEANFERWRESQHEQG